MQLTVSRQTYTPRSTCGTLSIDGEFQCFTLEPHADQSQGKPFSIPEGTYQVTLEFSPKFKCDTPHVQHVPGFEAIEIHYGNFPKDTEGCCLVGTTHAPDFVGNSRAAFAELMAKLKAAGTPLSVTYEKAAVP
ncbi:conserved hypothetical protein [Candidatus Koribacter versatilis Ellin345]|uniref:DUF5675 domain-containing protein n=1 Tax=Koribacter versatilis (strain Ellin345) TaxID=204669 RepID=Q1IV74_KORVE|nr:DUF5675 family protein [Candidatus Koribacter versatilis]ABF39226.1 conserved hypothetical protein [Candidatus Koribacter versatilis Ellin345]